MTSSPCLELSGEKISCACASSLLCLAETQGSSAGLGQELGGHIHGLCTEEAQRRCSADAFPHFQEHAVQKAKLMERSLNNSLPKSREHLGVSLYVFVKFLSLNGFCVGLKLFLHGAVCICTIDWDFVCLWCGGFFGCFPPPSPPHSPPKYSLNPD